MKAAGMPVAASAWRAAPSCCCTKPAAPACGMRVGTGWAASGSGVLFADPVTGIGPGVRPICRSSWRMMASDKPPFMPVSWLAYCWSSMSLPSLAPASSAMPMPGPGTAARMLFISSFMNSASNWRAASRTAPLGSVAARARTASSDRASMEGRLYTALR